ncbi:MAG: carbohydrate ABC transporter permease [Chloroflexi bacterium]|nr:carbohydrate ABC transporter permease [Chloroflexota bacterium]
MSDKQPPKKGPYPLVRVGIHALLLIGVIVAIFPFIWMLTTSLKSYSEVARGIWIPAHARFGNFAEAWNSAPFARYFFNSFFIALSTIVGVLFTSILAGYAFARIDFFGKNAIFILFLTTMMIPFEVTMIPNFIIVRRIYQFLHVSPPPLPLFGYTLLGQASSGWYNSYAAMIVPWTASVFSIFLFRQFFATIPEDLHDAAVLDGCGHFRFLTSIVLPLSRPAIVAVVLFTFLGSWNAFTWPLIITSSEAMRPITVGLSFFITDAGVDTQLLMAASTLTILPIVIIYFFAQKQFIEGIASSGLKG